MQKSTPTSFLLDDTCFCLVRHIPAIKYHMCVCPSGDCVCRLAACVSASLVRYCVQKDVGLQCLSSAADSTAAAEGTRLQKSRPPPTQTRGPVMKFMRNVRVQGGTGKVV